MVWFIKIVYLILFWSIDVLLYLKLVRNRTNVDGYLKITASVWAVLFFLYIPFLHIPYFQNPTVHFNLSAGVIQLLLAHYFFRYSSKRGNKRLLQDDTKATWNSMIMIGENITFVVIMLAHLMWALCAPIK
ncbi:hypothetical protein SAMN04487890_102154 [Mucilaginibacter polytrichastri]|nr:hypothetical protein SAMN04487890_102154 [Mucilaginibacter polytrichastri]